MRAPGALGGPVGGATQSAVTGTAPPLCAPLRRNPWGAGDPRVLSAGAPDTATVSPGGAGSVAASGGGQDLEQHITGDRSEDGADHSGGLRPGARTGREEGGAGT
jgi:hypothetical protein